MLCRVSKRTHILGSAFNVTSGLFGVLGWLLRFAQAVISIQSNPLSARR